MGVPELCRQVVLFRGLTGCRFSEMAALRVDDVVQTPHGLGVRVHRAATQSKRTSGVVFGPTDEDAPDADGAGAVGAGWRSIRQCSPLAQLTDLRAARSVTSNP